VPLLVSMPGVTKAGYLDNIHLVSNGLDFYATVCDFAGVEFPDGLHGRSLRPLLDENNKVEWPDHLVVETRFGSADNEARMVRTERYKYIVYGWGAYREQLFDLEQDPGEMVNLAVASRYKDVLQQHRNLLQVWCDKTNDTFNGHHYSHPRIPFRVPKDEYPQSIV
jgi:arylsulfatase A-like enzyme